MRFIYPIITVEDGGTVPNNSTKIYGVRVAIVSNEYAMGFIGQTNFTVSYMKNSNADLSDKQIKDRIDKYLLPANSSIEIRTI